MSLQVNNEKSHSTICHLILIYFFFADHNNGVQIEYKGSENRIVQWA